MTALVAAALVVLLGGSALGAVYRIVAGPSILDRMVASEVLLVTAMCAMLAEMTVEQHTRTLPVVLVIAALGFTGAVGVSRYVSSQRPSPDEPDDPPTTPSEGSR